MYVVERPGRPDDASDTGLEKNNRFFAIYFKGQCRITFYLDM